MVSVFSMSLLCALREQIYLPLEDIYGKARAPIVPCHLRGVTLWSKDDSFFQVGKGCWMVPGPGRTNGPPFPEGSGYNPLFAHCTGWLSQRGISIGGAERWCPTELLVTNLQPLFFLPRLHYSYINTKGFTFLKNTVKSAKQKGPLFLVPTVKLLEPLTSWSLPSHGRGMGAEKTHHLWPSEAPKIDSLPTLLLLWCSTQYWGECGLQPISNGWISKMDGRWSHESQVGILKKIRSFTVWLNLPRVQMSLSKEHLRNNLFRQADTQLRRYCFSPGLAH